VFPWEVYRALPKTAPLKPYRDGGRFSCVGKNVFLANDFDVIFDPDPSFVSKEYRTVGGPSFSCKSNMYRVDARGIRGAVRRVTCAREPDKLWLHEDLVLNQYEHVGPEQPWLSQWLLWYKHGLRQRLIDLSDSDEERSKWVEEAHPKRLLRRRARMDIDYDGRQGDFKYLRSIDYKCKSGELLPNNKYLRAVGDCTTHGSLKLGYYMKEVKAQFEEGYREGPLTLRFVKSPDLDELRQTFADLIQPPTPVYAVYFSDDACVSVKCSDGVLNVNSDLSAADGSNYAPIFDLLREAMSVDSRFDRDVHGAFKQLETVCVITNPEKGKQKVKLTPYKDPILYSGSVLTTSVNNQANTVIMIRFSKFHYFEGMTKQLAIEGLERAAWECGFILKCEVCPTYHHIQFLKYSPCINTSGSLEAVKNLGCAMRGYGTVIGDYPGRSRMGLEKRIRTFNSEVIRSRQHDGNHVISDAFRHHIVRDRVAISKTYMEEMVTGRQLGYVDSNELAIRYGLSSCALEELAGMIIIAQPGEIIAGPMLDVIFAKDYGFK